MPAQFFYYVLALAFGAGGAYFLLQQSRKDVNGIGRKLGQEISRATARHQNITVALMLLAPEDKKNMIADLLKERSGD